MTYLTAFVELFRFIKRYRDRAEARLNREASERAEERLHQRAMLETIFSKIVESQKVQAESIISLADAQRSQSNVMQTWLDGFKIADPTPQPPSVVRPEEEWLREQQRLMTLGGDGVDYDNLPPEFQLAYDLARGFNQDEDIEPEREG